MTETSSQVANTLITPQFTGGMRLLPGYSARIVEPDAAGFGRLALRGPGVFGGYANFDDTFRDRIRSFVRQVAAGVKPEDIDGSGLQGLKAQMIIHAAIESLNTGRVVYLDEMFPNYI